jgi:UDP-N-acetylmuramoylalanine--D-glutamate ligase
VTIGAILEIPEAKIREAVKNFKAVEHRLEYVSTVNGVEFYNDSKATNVDATAKAIAAFPGSIHLILGGKDKNSDYRVLNPLLGEKVTAVYTIGAAAAKIEAQIAAAGVPVFSSQTLENAVAAAARKARPGDVVLLAPACSSFDQFANYEQRGRRFKDLVSQLAQAPAAAGQGAG